MHENSKFKIQNSKFKIQNSKFKIQNSKFKIQLNYTFFTERSETESRHHEVGSTLGVKGYLFVNI